MGGVTSRISHTSVDARNSYAQSVWWAQVLDWTEDPDDPNLPEHEECLILSRDRAQQLLFIRVPDDKVVKNRLHLDLRLTDPTLDREARAAAQVAEAERLTGLGAALVGEQSGMGDRWIVMTDPAGNEFCIT